MPHWPAARVEDGRIGADRVLGKGADEVQREFLAIRCPLPEFVADIHPRKDPFQHDFTT
ncbi:MAG: hypothetical protein ABJL67_06175 [Sulfitobacter sp.]